MARCRGGSPGGHPADSPGSRDGRIGGRPRLPESVGGLLDAMCAFERGQTRLLEAWERERYPILRSALQAWVRDAGIGERLACRVVRGAFLAVRAGRQIHSELAWMAGVARRGRIQIEVRERSTGGRVPPDVRAPDSDPADEAARREACERVRRAIAKLPGEYRSALTLRYVLDRTEAEVAEYFRKRFGVSAAATRKILRLGRRMAELTLQGADPQALFRRRYGRTTKRRENPAAKGTPPTAFRNYLAFCGFGGTDVTPTGMASKTRFAPCTAETR